MAIKPDFNKSDIDKYFENELLKVRRVIERRLSYAGELFVNYARQHGSYEDQTGNLRSSVGYLITLDGHIISSKFDESEKGTDKKTGVEKGQEIAEQLAAGLKGYGLICVAGMDYAVYVEAKGKDVITGSAQQVQNWLKEIMA